MPRWTSPAHAHLLGALAILVAASSTGCAAPPRSEPPVTVTVTAEPDGAASAQEPAQEQPAPEEQPAEASAPAAEETFEMPALVGVDLQLAQDTLQALDSWVLDQTDASGLGRMQINDSNWSVCAQDPPPGSVVPISTVVTLASVKLDETCP